MYAKKDATEQLRKKYKVSIVRLEERERDGLYIVRAYVSTADGREDVDEGAVSIKGLSGEDLANATMKAVTKAKRRATLSICGLGFLDEAEIESVPDIRRVTIDHSTGEIIGGNVAQPTSSSPEQVAELLALGKQVDRDEAALLAWLKITNWKDLPAPLATKAIAKLRARVNSAQTPAADTADTNVATEAEKIMRDVVTQVKRLKLSDQLASDLHDLVIPDHVAGTEMTIEQAKKLLERLSKFKNSDAAVDWVGLQKDEARLQKERETVPQVDVFPKEEMQVLTPEHTTQAVADNVLFDDTDDL